jgi:nucleotidyltransferase/DNA polymerase involved in DNA repair
MRIACIHIPQFALQSATRTDPALRGAAVAVVSGVEPGREAAGVLHAPIVLACSRAAWGRGVRIGMTATAARGLAPDIEIVTANPANERETVRAIADALLGVSPTVDAGGRVGAGGAHLAMYAEVPAKTRGAAFGERLLELVDELGLTARIGIADDRFTAWVAAAHGGAEERGVIAVPRGGSAAFLAPRPLSLLAISPEVQHMLEALGVRTLGEFAALPAPSVARPLEADYQALARGESDARLRPYTPEAPIREEVAVSADNVLDLQDLLPANEQSRGLSFAAAVALVSRRIGLRLAGRGRAAVRLEITAISRDGSREVPVTLDRALADAEELGHVITPALESVAAEHASLHDDWRLRVAVVGEVVLGSELESTYAADAAASPIFAEGSTRHAALAPPAEPAPGAAAVARPEHGGAADHDARDMGSDARLRDRDRRTLDHPPAQPIDPLAVVLSSSGSLFALSPPTTLRAERRDAHRGMRRGKQRRSRPTPSAQPRLFDRVSKA